MTSDSAVTEPAESPIEIDPMLYRQVLGHFPTGVTVISSQVVGTFSPYFSSRSLR